MSDRIDASHMNEAAVASRLGITVRGLQGWRLRGRGPRFLKVGRFVRYRLADVICWEEAQVRSSTSDPGPSAQPQARGAA
jgi:hypothetical protein